MYQNQKQLRLEARSHLRYSSEVIIYKGTCMSTNKSAQDLATEALGAIENEAEASDKLAETITHLQNIIERNALELQRVQNELKEKRQSLRNVMENDVQLAEISAEVEKVTQQVKERKAQLSSSPQTVSLKANVAELNQQKKEIEETLSNHLINYYGLTNSTSFDTSEGDQWEFKISAKVKAQKN